MIYLDSAATTLQKPRAVPQATAAAMLSAASPGRGGHKPGQRAAEITFTCRELAAEMFGAEDPDHVVLTCNATHGLNIAVRSLVKTGGTVLISGYEHNAVTRPLAAVPGVQIRVAAAPVFDREKILDTFRQELKGGRIDAVFCNHVSNVFGFILPVEEIAALCVEHEVPFVLDASQSAGVLPVRMNELRAAFIAMPGHKGLYGPQGTGLLLCGGDDVVPVISGGTGSLSALQQMPDFLPDRLEAGTHNVCGAAGLVEGLRFVKRKGLHRISEHERRLNHRMMTGLEKIPAVHVFRGDTGSQSGLCSFFSDTMDCELIGEKLAERGIAVRAGLHCAPLAHRSAGTEEKGTVRVSFSVFNSEQDVDRTLWILREILR